MEKAGRNYLKPFAVRIFRKFLKLMGSQVVSGSAEAIGYLDNHQCHPYGVSKTGEKYAPVIPAHSLDEPYSGGES